ncbi:hypothetical protein LTS03_004326 [Exophiala xenobiotica]|nr:hypothetical protein LTR14_006692 [Exophiala xenobiotica]KAK5379447.1 hypothetical protein LTS03_004326 [Exophiala xenobiotica]KAK5404449.1 hypothetical protein LTR06_009596 [Exophiala xenobiotica]KAK5480067.1 hypothetical protein LTR55_007430 [Exophiala xenobiotica]
MDQLPAELIGHLCLFFDKASLCALRLTCHVFAAIAEKHLFKDLEFRLYPNHHRLYQFEQLAANASIAARLRCVTFESGVQLEYADCKYWQAQVYADKSRAWEGSLATRGAVRDEYLLFHETLQARFTTEVLQRYDLFRWHLDQQAALVAEQNVKNNLLRTLNNLKQSSPGLRFKLIMTEPQIELEDLEAFKPEEYASDKPYDPDPRRRVANRRQYCLDHFINFLDAANLSHLEVDELTALDIPHELLTRGGQHSHQVLEETFRSLRRLDVKISAFPHSDWLSRLGTNSIYVDGRNNAAWRLRMLLNQSSKLEELALEFPAGMESEYSFELFDRTNLDRFPRLWLPHLKSLVLCKLRCSWEDLEAFLDEAMNVKSLVMKDCRLERGSMLDLLDYLNKKRVPQVELLGAWFVDEDSGEWHSHTEDDFTTCSAAISFEGPYSRCGMRSRVAGYIRGESECPLPRWTTEYNSQLLWETMNDTSWHYLRMTGQHPQ